MASFFLRKYTLRYVIECPPRIREPDLVALPTEQLNLEALVQGLDLGGNRGLSNVQGSPSRRE